MTDEVDIAVIGAGPAGATAARVLAAAGRQVLLLEGERLPRHKTCGGGLPKRTLDALGFSLPPGMAHSIETATLDGAVTGRQLYSLSPGGTVVVVRADFDAFLAAQAVAAGARLQAASRVCHAERLCDGRLRLSASSGMVTARAVVLATGVASRLARELGFPPGRLGFCVEGQVSMPPGVAAAARTRAVFNLALLRRGYGWSFPRGDVYAVGVGVAAARFPGAAQALARLCRATPELRGSPPQQVRGAMLPDFSAPRARYAAAGVYLAGDAAGLVDPLTGEGIYYAIQSGRLAAEAILAGGEAAYEQRLHAELLPDLVLGAKYAKVYHALPVWWRACGMALPGFRRCARRFVDILEGRRTYTELFDSRRR